MFKAYILGENLVKNDIDWILENKTPAVFLVSSKYSQKILEKLNIEYEYEPTFKNEDFSKVETLQNFITGTFSVPKLIDILGIRYNVNFFIDATNIVIVDDDDFSDRIIKHIQAKKIHQGDTKEIFLYNFIAEIIGRDISILIEYEKKLSVFENDILNGKNTDLQKKIIPIRNELLTLREYYDELTDFGHELEENENDFFDKKYVKYFGIISDRADRLMNRTVHLLARAQQIWELYQAIIDAKQNNNMRFLTIISTIFLPLTLITSWYGMNFQNMPELENGYPFVIVLCVVVIIGCIIVFKKKKFL